MVTPLLMLCSCTSHHMEFTAVSTRALPCEPVNINKLPQTVTTGSATVPCFNLFPLFSSASSGGVSRAIEDALKKGNGDMMVDATMSATNFGFLIGFKTYKITGTVVNVKAAQ